MDTMYPAKINSPATTLSGDINDAVTTIPLTDASVLPAAPNLATIGTGEDAETILYLEIDVNDLKQVIRGFQGTAKAWATGTAIARMFTAYDLDTLKTNVGGAVMVADLENPPTEDEASKAPTSEWAFDHNAAVLSTTIHNNNNYFLGYGNESVIDPARQALVKIPALVAIADPASGLDVSDWYGASGAYRQSDADSDATHIEDDDANFPNSIDYTLVKWASNAAGTLNTGIGVITTVDSDTLTIVKFTGANFAASYYYWIKHSEWIVPVTGLYYIKAAVLYLPSEADKRFEVRVFYYSGTSVPVQLVQGVASSGLTDYEFPAISCLTSLTAGDHLYSTSQHGGTSGTPDIFTNHASHLPLEAFLLKQTA